MAAPADAAKPWCSNGAGVCVKSGAVSDVSARPVVLVVTMARPAQASELHPYHFGPNLAPTNTMRMLELLMGDAPQRFLLTDAFQSHVWNQKWELQISADDQKAARAHIDATIDKHNVDIVVFMSGRVREAFGTSKDNVHQPLEYETTHLAQDKQRSVAAVFTHHPRSLSRAVNDDVRQALVMVFDHVRAAMVHADKMAPEDLADVSSSQLWKQLLERDLAESSWDRVQRQLAGSTWSQPAEWWVWHQRLTEANAANK